MWISEKRIKKRIDWRANEITNERIEYFMDYFGFQFSRPGSKDGDDFPWREQQYKEYPLLKEFKALLKYFQLEFKVTSSNPSELIITKIKKTNKK